MKLNKKYNEAMKFIDEEIDTANGLFEQYLRMAELHKKNSEDNSDDIRRADEWHHRLCALRELRLRLISKIGSY